MNSMETAKTKKNTSKSFSTAFLSMVKRNISGWLLLIIPVSLFVMIVWRPIVNGVLYSFFELKGFTLEKFVGLRNYIDVLTDVNFTMVLKNTVKYVFWSVVIGMPLPVILAIILNEMVHGKNFFKFVLYLPCIIPGIAISLIWKMIYMDGPGGMLNMLLSYIGMEPVSWLSNGNIAIPLIVISMIWQGLGGSVIMYFAALQNANRELYEAASLDGAGFFQKLWHITLPCIGGTILLLTIRNIIGIFQIVEQPLAMTGGGPNGASMSLGLQNYFYAFKFGQYEKSVALGVVSFVMMLLLTLVYYRIDKKLED